MGTKKIVHDSFMKNHRRLFKQETCRYNTFVKNYHFFSHLNIGSCELGCKDVKSIYKLKCAENVMAYTLLH